MPYIGRDTDKLSNIEVLDNITFDGSSSYTLQKGGSNFIPSSANTLLLSIDGVVQAGNFTVSGSTIDFGTAVAATSTCDFILHYGTGLITTPADGTVTTAKIGSNAVTTAKIADANVTSAKMFSGFKNGITMADQWRLTVTLTGSDGDITSGLERVDDATFAKIGTGMTESSGVFTFPSTGLYQVIQSLTMTAVNDARASVYMNASSDSGSNYDQVARTDITSTTSASVRATSSQTTFINVTNASTYRVKFTTDNFSASSNIVASTDFTVSSFTFIRLGDSV